MAYARDKIACFAVNTFDVMQSESEKNNVDWDRAFVEYATQIFGDIIENMADKAMTFDEAMERLTEEACEEAFNNAVECSEIMY